MKDKDGCKMKRVTSTGIKTRNVTRKLQALADRNVAQSPLLRLPAEVRKYDSSCNEVDWEDDENPEWELMRSLCVNADTFHPVPAHCESTLTSTSAEQLSTTFASAHQKCTSRDTTYHGAFNGDPRDFFKGELLPFNWKFYSGILAASRQIYQESVLLFWRTNWFCFNEGGALDDLLDRLTKIQRANLRHVVLFHHFYSYEQTKYVRDSTRSEWLGSIVQEGKDHALRNLDCLELHLQLDGHAGYPTADSKEFQLESVKAAFKVLEDLRFWQPRRSSVTVSYGEFANSYCKATVRKAEFSELAERFRQRLLDSKITHEDRLERLTDRAEDLKRSLTNEENFVTEHQEKAQMFQAMADDGRARAGEMKNRLDELEALLSRHDAAEIKDFLGI